MNIEVFFLITRTFVVINHSELIPESSHKKQHLLTNENVYD